MSKSKPKTGSSREKSISKHSISDLRSSIDQIDRTLLKLLNKRAKIVKQVGELKKILNRNIHDPNREKEILDKIIKEPHPHLLDSEVKYFFQNLITFFRTTEAAHTIKLSSTKLPKKCKIGFIGFGLIGASIGLGLKNQFSEWNFEIVDPFINRNKFSKWCKLSKADKFNLTTEDKLMGCDFVFLCAPITVNESKANLVIKRNKMVLNTGSVLTDFPSLYGFHPLAGKEQSLFHSAQEDLFFGKTICITNINNLPREKLELIKNLTYALGAKPWVGTSETHNEKMAISSHLVQILAIVYGESLSHFSWKNELELLPPNAKNLLRLTGSNLEMWEPILKINNLNIMKAIKIFKLELNRIELELKRKNGIKKIFSKGSRIYKNIYQKGNLP